MTDSHQFSKTKPDKDTQIANVHGAANVHEVTQVHVLLVQDRHGARAYRLDRAIFTLGRSQKADIQIVGHAVSRIHATLFRRRNGQGKFYYHLIDGDARCGKPSQNGTYVNGHLIQSHNLANHDRIIFSASVKAKFLQLNPKSAQDLISAPERWIKATVNRIQEQETFMTDLDSTLKDLNLEREKSEREKSKREKLPREQETSDRSIAKSKVPSQALPPFANPRISGSQKLVAYPRKSITKPGNSFAIHTKLGQFFLRANLIRPDQLQQALKRQTKTKQKLGELLLEAGLISKTDLKQALINQRVHLGEILVKRKLISMEQLKKALTRQGSVPKQLGEILVREGLISPKELASALKEQQLRRKGFWLLKD